MLHKHFVLIGMMGAWKSAIGKTLALHLGIRFYDVDSEIERRVQKKSKQLFADNGEDYFRQLEREVIRDLLSKETAVIATDSEAFAQESTRKLITESAIAVWLNAKIDTLSNGLENLEKTDTTTERKEKLSKLLRKRKFAYRHAHIIINTDKKTADEIIDNILSKYSNLLLSPMMQPNFLSEEVHAPIKPTKYAKDDLSLATLNKPQAKQNAVYNSERYLKYIGLGDAQLKVDFVSLKTIVLQHLKHFPYQNYDIYSAGKKSMIDRHIPSLSKDALYQQMVLERKGGNCFQNNELLAIFLQHLGFNIQRHLAKVINQPLSQKDQNAINQSSYAHEILLVCLAEKKFIIDVGFSHNSLRAPLEMKLGMQAIGNDQYQLFEINNHWEVNMVIGKDWFCLYQMDSLPQSVKQITAAYRKIFLSNNRVPIRDNFLKLGFVTETQRRSLVWSTDAKDGRFFKTYENDDLKGVALQSPQEAIKTAEKEFACKVPEIAEAAIYCIDFKKT